MIIVSDDLTKTYKEYYSFHYRTYMDILVPASIKRSDEIITISKSTKNDISISYEINPDLIQVYYL